MTPAEWRCGEMGVVLVDVVARRLRGQPRGLLHGNGDDGERVCWGATSNAGTQEQRCVFVQEDKKECRSIWKAAQGLVGLRRALGVLVNIIAQRRFAGEQQLEGRGVDRMAI